MKSKLLELFLTQSERLNLISKGDRERLEDKHFPDCLEFLKLWRSKGGQAIIDIGTGGGLPGLVLADSLSQCDFTLVDARQKKIDAILEMSAAMKLKNVHGIAGRFEHLAHDVKFREVFDGATARAVAPLPVLLEYAVGFLKPGGKLFAWKGPHYQEELNDAREAMELLHLELEQEHHYTLPSGETRVILVFVKTLKTPSTYPREDGKPKKAPL